MELVLRKEYHGDQSKMALLFVDRTQIRLAQNSVLQIKEVSQGKDSKTILNLNKGRSWMQSKTVPGGLIMETPSALASIRGTDWEIVVEPDGYGVSLHVRHSNTSRRFVQTAPVERPIPKAARRMTPKPDS